MPGVVLFRSDKKAKHSLVELGYDLGGPGCDTWVELNKEQRKELRDLLQTETGVIADDLPLPDGIGFGRCALYANNEGRTYRVTVMTKIQTHTLICVYDGENDSVTYYYADIDVYADAEALSNSLKPS